MYSVSSVCTVVVGQGHNSRTWHAHEVVEHIFTAPTQIVVLIANANTAGTVAQYSNGKQQQQPSNSLKPTMRLDACRHQRIIITHEVNHSLVQY